MSNPATTLQTDMNTLDNIDKQIAQSKIDLEIAKLRASSIQNPKPSYYESWFPINRPLRDVTKLILLSVGIFFFCLTFFAILHSFGFIIDINITWINKENIDKLSKLFPIGSIIVIVALLILTIIGWLRKA